MSKKVDYRKQFELDGRVAVVTGGAGILGKRFCAALADFGAKVAVVDLDEEQSKLYAEELKQAYGVECIGIGCDVSQPESVQGMVERVEQMLGPISILHNNAATKGSNLEKFLAPIEEYSLETWQEIMAVNLDGLFLVAKEIGTRMAERGYGSIIQTASIYGATMGPDSRIYEGSHYMGMPINTPPVYPTSKAGVVGLGLYLATHWARQGVRVNTLTPGGVESGQNEEFKRRYSGRVPMQRMADGDEMVGALLFLASDASSYITGQNIMVDGGLSAW